MLRCAALCRRPRSLAGAAAVGVAAAALWAALLGALAVAAFVRGELRGGIRFWPQVGGQDWHKSPVEGDAAAGYAVDPMCLLLP